MTDTLIIIVTYNSAKWLDRCLGSIVNSSHPADAMIVDNCSQDGTPDLVSSGWPQFKLVRNSENLGFGAANNIGLKYALEKGYSYVYLLNSDAWLERDTLEILIGAFDAGGGDGRWGILSPIQKDTVGKLDKNFEKKCGKYLKKNASDRLIEVPFVMAAHWLMTAECVRRVGGFSPVFRQYGEDDNYIDRLRYHGLRCAVVPAASAVHDRASRALPKCARMKLKTVSSLVHISNPARCFTLAFCLEIFVLLGMGVKNFSPEPVKFIRNIFKRRAELKKFRKFSRAASAFLDQIITS